MKAQLGMSPDEMSFMSEKYGKLDFFETISVAWKDTCKHCLLWNSGECLRANCISMQRIDGKNGYFSIQQMPEV